MSGRPDRTEFYKKDIPLMMFLTYNHIRREIRGERTGLEFPAGAFEIKLSIPLIDIQMYWSTVNPVPVGVLPWRLNLTANGVCQLPYLSLFNRSGCNRCTIALAQLDDDAEMGLLMNQGGQCYDLTIKGCAGNPFTFIADLRAMDWQEVYADYRRQVMPHSAWAYPEGAWRPVYCTWYALHTQVNSRNVEANAALAAQLGFGTIILDDGWCFDAVKRHCPELLPTWYAEIGDWEVSKLKFPDFAEHVRKVQAMGLRYMLWTAPLVVGIDSDAHRQLSEHHGLEAERIDGFHPLNVANADAVDMMIEKMVALMERYHLDGLKVDYLSVSTPPSATAGKGCFAVRMSRKLTAAIRQHKPDALIEYRQNYCLPDKIDLATQFRCMDVPFDFCANFQRIAQLRLQLGDGVPIHADPIYFNDAETMENIGAHMAAALAGVPMLSVELNSLPDDRRRIFADYLRIYRRINDFHRCGHWEMFYDGTMLYKMTATCGGRKIAWIASAAHWTPAAAGEYEYIFNLTADTLPVERMQGVAAGGSLAAAGAIPPGGYGVPVNLNPEGNTGEIE